MPYKNTKQQVDAVKAWHQRMHDEKARIIEEAKAGGCIRCGEMDTLCLDFHHRNPADKSFPIGSGGQANKRIIAALQAEIAKCVVLCSNCHRKLHGGRFTIDMLV